jgi:transcriptional regulator
MYIPKSFREDDIAKLHALMQEYSFAALISQQPDGVPFATHLPFLLDAERGPYGTLLAHMARANPHWRSFDAAQEVLVIFQGPHTYISPSWYLEKLSVPTWNYAVVHAYGKPRIIEDQAEMYHLLQAQVQKFESQFEKPWQFASLPEDFTYGKIKGTVGFEMEITRLEGKFKISQNRPKGDQVRVAATLKDSQDPMNVSVAELMERRRETE